MSSSGMKAFREWVQPRPFARGGWPCTIAIVIAATATVRADVSDYDYVTVGSDVIITGYDCSVSNAVAIIPDVIDGMPVAGIGNDAFDSCSNLTSVTIPNSVTTIGANAFDGCSALTSVYFTGDAPTVASNGFSSSIPTVYYLAGTTGWGPTLGGRPTSLYTWPAMTGIVSPSAPGSGVTLEMAGDPDMLVAIQDCANLVSPVWVDVATTPLTGGASTVPVPDSTHHESRFYRVWPR